MAIENYLELRTVYLAWNTLICIDCFSYYLWMFTNLKNMYPYGFTLPWVTLVFGTIVVFLFVVSLFIENTIGLKLIVASANAMYLSAALMAIILDLFLFAFA